MKRNRLIALLLSVCMTATSVLPILANEDVSADVVDEIKAVVAEADYNATETSIASDLDTAENMSDTKSGKCGDNLTWVLTDDGVLTISGTGEMWDYEVGTTWILWDTFEIKKCIIEDGVNSIGSYAFYCSNLSDISLPNTLVKIGDYAFYSCANLTTISIPKSVKNIGKWAFRGCKKLEDIYFSDGIENIDTGAFIDCIAIENIILPESLVNIGDSVFQGCTSLLSVEIPSSVINIGEKAFQSCYSLNKVTIPDSVISIGGGAFNYCSALSKVIIPNSITSIEFATFSHCTSLTEIELPNTVTVIGQSAFYDCISLTEIEIPNSVTAIGERAFQGCTALTSVKIPNSVVDIGVGAFVLCSELESAYFYGDVPNQFGRGVFESTKDNFIIYYIDGKSGWTTPTWTSQAGDIYNTATFVPEEDIYPIDKITTTFDTSDLTLAVGEAYTVSGNITTTAETGLNNIQINLNSATEQGVGIILDRKENVGILNYNLADSAIILTAGETYTGLDQGGNEQTITLTPGTSWYVQVYATDKDGNSIGDGVKKKINIIDNVANNFAGKTLYQTTNIAALSDIPSIHFENSTDGVFHFVYPEKLADVPFTYTINGSIMVLKTEQTEYFSEIVFNIVGESEIELASYTNVYGYSLGWTSVGDRFTVKNNEAEYLIGRKYLQTTNTDGLTSIPYLYFENSTDGVFYIVDSEPSLCFEYPFTYTVSGEMITLTSTTEGGFHGDTPEIILRVIDNDTLEVFDYEYEYMLGWTKKGDIFEAEVTQVKPTVDGLEESYTITQGEDLNLNFTIEATGNNNLEIVNLTNQTTKKVLLRKTDINLNTYNVDVTIPYNEFNSVGEYTIVVYAKANNFMNGEIARFKVIANCSHAYEETTYESYEKLGNDVFNTHHKLLITKAYICKYCKNEKSPKEEVVQLQLHSQSIKLENGVWICKCGYAHTNSSEEFTNYSLKNGYNIEVYKSITTNGNLIELYDYIDNSNNPKILGKLNNVYFVEYIHSESEKRTGFIESKYVTKNKEIELKEPNFIIYSPSIHYNLTDDDVLETQIVLYKDEKNKEIQLFDMNNGLKYNIGDDSLSSYNITWKYKGDMSFNEKTGEIGYKWGVGGGGKKGYLKLYVNGVEKDSIIVWCVDKCPEITLSLTATYYNKFKIFYDIRPTDDVIEASISTSCSKTKKLKEKDKFQIGWECNGHKEYTTESGNAYVSIYVTTEYGEYSKSLNVKTHNYNSDYQNECYKWGYNNGMWSRAHYICSKYDKIGWSNLTEEDKEIFNDAFNWEYGWNNLFSNVADYVTVEVASPLVDITHSDVGIPIKIVGAVDVLKDYSSNLTVKAIEAFYNDSGISDYISGDITLEKNELTSDIYEHVKLFLDTYTTDFNDDIATLDFGNGVTMFVTEKVWDHICADICDEMYHQIQTEKSK